MTLGSPRDNTRVPTLFLPRSVPFVQSLSGNWSTTGYTHNDLGSLTQVNDALAQITRFEYDSVHNRITGVIDALDRATTYAYDAEGNLLTSTDPLSGVVSYTYDSCCLPTILTDASGRTTSYDYDAYGNLAEITDAMGYTTVCM